MNVTANLRLSRLTDEFRLFELCRHAPRLSLPDGYEYIRKHGVPRVDRPGECIDRLVDLRQQIGETAALAGLFGMDPKLSREAVIKKINDFDQAVTIATADFSSTKFNAVKLMQRLKHRMHFTKQPLLWTASVERFIANQGENTQPVGDCVTIAALFSFCATLKFGITTGQLRYNGFAHRYAFLDNGERQQFFHFAGHKYEVGEIRNEFNEFSDIFVGSNFTFIASIMINDLENNMVGPRIIDRRTMVNRLICAERLDPFDPKISLLKKLM